MEVDLIFLGDVAIENFHHDKILFWEHKEKSHNSTYEWHQRNAFALSWMWGKPWSEYKSNWMESFEKFEASKLPRSALKNKQNLL